MKKVNLVPAKSAAAKPNDPAPPKEPIFPTQFFAVMDELDDDTRKVRAAACESMRKTAAK